MSVAQRSIAIRWTQRLLATLLILTVGRMLVAAENPSTAGSWTAGQRRTLDALLSGFQRQPKAEVASSKSETSPPAAVTATPAPSAVRTAVATDEPNTSNWRTSSQVVVPKPTAVESKPIQVEAPREIMAGDVTTFRRTSYEAAPTVVAQPTTEPAAAVEPAVLIEPAAVTPLIVESPAVESRYSASGPRNPLR